MRVLLLSANFAPHVGGIERFTEILASGLAERGHDVHVIGCRWGNAQMRELRDGFSVERIRSTYVLDRRLHIPYPVPEPVGLIKSLTREVARADIVHVQDVLYATSLPALLLAQRHRIASVLTKHTGFVPQRTPTLDALQRSAYAVLGPCARLATIVATYNRAVADWVAGQWKVSDVRVLPVGVSTPAGDPLDRAAVRRSFGLPANRFLALFVGRDVRVKGLDIFLDAADPAYQLVAVTDRADVERETAVLLPFMSPDRLQALMRCVDAFVLPSESEGFPLSLQEALSHGLPVVTTFLPGYDRYLATDDVLSVERTPQSVRDAIRRLAHNDDLRSRMSTLARAAGERHFGAEKFVTAYETLYAEAIERERLGRR